MTNPRLQINVKSDVISVVTIPFVPDKTMLLDLRENVSDEWDMYRESLSDE